jgi:hypothetical protein
MKPIYSRLLVQSGKDPVDVHAGHDHLRDQELVSKYQNFSLRH